MRYDTITELINRGINSPFTAAEAYEFLGDAMGFGSCAMPTLQMLRGQLPRDARVMRIGDRRGDALYEFLIRMHQSRQE